MRCPALAPVAALAGLLLVLPACVGDDDDAGVGGGSDEPASSTTGVASTTTAPAPTTTGAVDPSTTVAAGTPGPACESIAGGPEAVAGLPTGQALAALGPASQFAAAVNAAGLNEELDGVGPFTVFVPIDTAFDAVGDDLATPEQFVAGHIVDGAASTVDQLAVAGAAAGRVDAIVVTDTGDGVLIDRGGGPATVVCADVATTNGMLQLVDAVLLPAPVDSEAVGGSQLYRVDLTTGAATSIGAFDAEVGVLGLTADVASGTLFGLTDAGELISFPPDDPAAAVSAPITGVEGATLLALDTDTEGRMLAVSDAGLVYQLDAATGAATPLGGPLEPAIDDPGFAFDIDPASGAGRIVVATGNNIPVDLGTGAAGTPGAPPTFDAEDTNVGQAPRVVAGAYSPDDDVLYVIDATTGSLAATESPDSGVLLTVGPLGVPLTDGASFDIAPGGLAYLSVPG